MTVHFEPIKDADPSGVGGYTSHSEAKSSFYRSYGKRLLESAVIIASAPVVLPVMLLVTVLLLVTGQSPFYFQQRVGRAGRLFTIWKFQTMVPNADAALEAYLKDNPDARAEWDATQKLKDDPRVTLVGKFLRKSSLDELPQLINVLKGDMSLIGPRPMLPEQRSLYPGAAYYKLRPGITGPWQVSERNESEFKDRARYDAGYLRDVSLREDARLFGRTLGVMVRGTGC